MAPWRTARVNGPSTHTVSPPLSRNRPTRSAEVMSSWPATVISSRPSAWAIDSTKRVLPQPVGPFSRTGTPRLAAARKISTSSPTAQYDGASTVELATSDVAVNVSVSLLERNYFWKLDTRRHDELPLGVDVAGPVAMHRNRGVGAH